jgi:hypothetical protein
MYYIVVKWFYSLVFGCEDRTILSRKIPRKFRNFDHVSTNIMRSRHDMLMFLLPYIEYYVKYIPANFQPFIIRRYEVTAQRSKKNIREHRENSRKFLSILETLFQKF